MSFFPETVAAKMADRQLAASLLVHMDFRDTPRRFWAGFGDLEAGGHIWQGTGSLIQIDGLEQALGTNAPRTTFSLSGVDASIVTLARQSSARVKDRPCQVFLQFFELAPDGDQMPWAKLDEPYTIWSGIMDQMTYGSEGASQRRVSLTAESIWTGRRRPAYGFWTDRDQNARFPGDRGLEQVVNLVNKTIRWPTFVFWLLAGVAAAAYAPMLYPILPVGHA